MISHEGIECEGDAELIANLFADSDNEIDNHSERESTFHDCCGDDDHAVRDSRSFLGASSNWNHDYLRYDAHGRAIASLQDVDWTGQRQLHDVDWTGRVLRYLNWKLIIFLETILMKNEFQTNFGFKS